MMHVRLANSADKDWLKAQLKEFADFFGTKKSLFGAPDHVDTGLEELIMRHLVLIAEASTPEGTERAGMIVGTIGPHMMNPEIRVLAEMFWWVSRKWRASRAAVMLLEAFIDYGKANADWITFVLEDMSPVRDKTLERKGFRLKERMFLMEV